MKLLVKHLEYGDPDRALGYRWSVAGEGIPAIAGMRWTARRLQSIEAFARLLGFQHLAPAYLVVHGGETQIFTPTRLAIESFVREPMLFLEELEVDPSLPRGTTANVCNALSTGDRPAPQPEGAATPGPELAGGRVG